MTVTIKIGDCRDILRTMPDESVHCVVTSPPYWGLRDYGTARWEGGSAECDHKRFNGYLSGLSGTTDAQDSGKFFKDKCGKCGARRIDRQLGMETSLGEYVETMTAIFAEVRRVLRKDGTLWINLGDSYVASPNGRSAAVGPVFRPGSNGLAGFDAGYLKPKDLCGIPWRVAFALQDAGWYLRQDIIWSKPNPMPESVTDRCTKAHEYIFLMSKSPRYYYDADAIAEEAVGPAGGNVLPTKGAGQDMMRTRNGLHLCQERARQNGGFEKRNKRSVWEIPTAPFSEAHFATFPPALIEPCILAGCPEGGTVLDPFGGAGTTGLVADRLRRNAILIELNPEYAAMAERRIRGDAGMFAELTMEERINV